MSGTVGRRAPAGIGPENPDPEQARTVEPTTTDEKERGKPCAGGGWHPTMPKMVPRPFNPGGSMKAERIFNTVVALVCWAFFLLPVVAVIRHTSEQAREDREFRAQQEEYRRVMTQKIREYNEMMQRAKK